MMQWTTGTHISGRMMGFKHFKYDSGEHMQKQIVLNTLGVFVIVDF